MTLATFFGGVVVVVAATAAFIAVAVGLVVVVVVVIPPLAWRRPDRLSDRPLRWNMSIFEVWLFYCQFVKWLTMLDWLAGAPHARPKNQSQNFTSSFRRKKMCEVHFRAAKSQYHGAFYLSAI